MTSSQVASPDWRGAERGESARDYAVRRAQDLERHLAAHHGDTAALIVEPLVQGATGMAMYDRRIPAPRARAVRPLRGASHRRRDHDRLRAHRHVLRSRAGRHHARLPLLSKGLTGGYLPLSVVLTRDADLRGVLRRRRHARVSPLAFVHRQSRSPAARRSRRSAIFEEDDVIAANRARAARLTAAAARHRRAPARARFPQHRDDLGFRVRYDRRLVRAEVLRAARSSASCSCVRSATRFISCRRT